MKHFWPWRGRGVDKVTSALAAILVTATIGYTLVAGLRVAPRLSLLADSSPLALFDLERPEPRPEPTKPVKRRSTDHEARPPRPAPSPRAENSQKRLPPAAIVAPVPAIVLPAPLLPAAGSPMGQGVGTGNSNGNGEGGSGAGNGRGAGEGGEFSRARQTGGRFRNSDFPASARGAGRIKTGVRYAIGPLGRVASCEVIESSGYAEVDAMTCRVIMERYRFRPARDPDGFAVTEVREEDYRWRVR